MRRAFLAIVSTLICILCFQNCASEKVANEACAPKSKVAYFFAALLGGFSHSNALSNKREDCIDEENYKNGRVNIIYQYSLLRYEPACHINDENPISKDAQCPQMFYIDLDKLVGAEMHRCLSAAMSPKKCSNKITKIVQQFTAKIILRYKFADLKEVNLECQADPEKCKTFQSYELLILDSHNKFIDDKMREAIAKYDRNYANHVTEKIQQREIDDEIRQLEEISSQRKYQTCSIQKNYTGGYYANCF